MNYSAKVVEHFLHPRNTGVIDAASAAADEKIISADAGQIGRGDALRVSLRVGVADQKIREAKFQNFGTGMPIAGASRFCEMIQGRTLDEALKVTAEDLDRELDGLPELPLRKPILVLDAFDSAFRQFRGLPPRERALPGEPPLCTCFQVPESVIERAIRLRRLTTVDEITAVTRAGAGCHTCHPEIEEIIERCRRREYRVHIPLEEFEAARRLYGAPPQTPEELAANPPAPVPERSARTAEDGFVYPDKSPVAEIVQNATARQRANRRPWKEMSHAERLQRLEEVLEYDLRPAIRADGGDIKLVDLKDSRVLVTLHGHCKNCHSALSTLKMGVEKRLQEAVWPELEVEEVW